MPTLNFRYRAEIVDESGQSRALGDLGTALQLSVTGRVFDQTFSIGTSTAVKVFDIDEDLGDFDFLCITCDFDLMLELVTDDDGNVGEEFCTMGLLGTGKANKHGIPFILARDDSYANATVAFAGGTLDLIETIRVKNLSGSQAATCRVFAVT